MASILNDAEKPSLSSWLFVRQPSVSVRTKVAKKCALPSATPKAGGESLPEGLAGCPEQGPECEKQTFQQRSE